MLGSHNPDVEEGLYQLDADLLQQNIWGVGEKGTEALERRGLLVGVESEGGHNRRTFHQMGVELSEEPHTTQSLVDTGFE